MHELHSAWWFSSPVMNVARHWRKTKWTSINSSAGLRYFTFLYLISPLRSVRRMEGGERGICTFCILFFESCQTGPMHQPTNWCITDIQLRVHLYPVLVHRYTPTRNLFWCCICDMRCRFYSIEQCKEAKFALKKASFFCSAANLNRHISAQNLFTHLRMFKAGHLQDLFRSSTYSCIDCNAVFTSNSYKDHIKCISEDQKYGGKNFVQKENKVKFMFFILWKGESFPENLVGGNGNRSAMWAGILYWWSECHITLFKEAVYFWAWANLTDILPTFWLFLHRLWLL